MPLQLPQVVAELIQAVGFGGKLEGGEYGLVNLFGSPAADVGATVQEDFQQANDPGFMDFDSGIADGADSHGQGQTLQQRKIKWRLLGYHPAHSVELPSQSRKEIQVLSTEQTRALLRAASKDRNGALFVHATLGEQTGVLSYRALR